MEMPGPLFEAFPLPGENSMMFCAVAVICQLSIETGETTLFDVDYDDQQFTIFAYT